LEIMSGEPAGARVRAEIGDVMIYLVRLADVLGIDLLAAARDKLDDSARRYPIEGSRGTARKAPA
jgi:NTP pyrophosphatase (non-canonical NTP hydrolase)